MQIINANLDLVSRSVEPAADKEALEDNKQIVRQLDLAASLRTWLALQGHVNSLLDSSTASQADVSVSALRPALPSCAACTIVPLWHASVHATVAPGMQCQSTAAT